MERDNETRRIRIVVLKHQHSDLLMAVSPDHKGLNVVGRSYEEIEKTVVEAVKDLFEAEGRGDMRVILEPEIPVDAHEFKSPVYIASAQPMAA